MIKASTETTGGSFVLVPRRAAHCFHNIGAQAGRIAHDNWMRVVGPPLAESRPLPVGD
ncbi:hypothetical protein BH24CHL5_BH24CHL5_06870 [soil metagenome]